MRNSIASAVDSIEDDIPFAKDDSIIESNISEDSFIRDEFEDNGKIAASKRQIEA